MIKRDITRHFINLIVAFFILATIFISVYFYLAAKTNISSMQDSISAIKSLIQGSSAAALESQTTAMLSLFIFQIIIFVVAISCLIIAFWFVSQLYLIHKKNALIDPLTELYNKRAVNFALTKEIKRAIRFKHHLAIALLDIDFFKSYNDTLGHVAGDRLLKRFARLLLSDIRTFDVVGRIGGEEFMIIFPETNIHTAAQVCERIRKLIATTPFAGEEKLPHKKVTVSIGLASFAGERAINAETLAEKADINLYKAKKSGRNLVVY